MGNPARELWLTVFGSSLALLMGCTYSMAEENADRLLLPIGSEIEAASAHLQQHCHRVDQLQSDSPSLPTTREAEAFLICAVPGGEIGYSFSDRFLVLAEVRGSALVDRVLTGFALEEPPVAYAGLDIYPAVALALNSEGDQAWVLSPENLHAHLFLSSHPLMEQTQALEVPTMAGRLLPLDIEIGASLAELRTLLSASCPLYGERQIEPPSLPGAIQSQIQINCFGLNIAGFPRKVELVFGDGSLELMWVLTGAEESDRLQSYLSALYGQPNDESGRYIVWSDGVALRLDVPEIMIASPTVAAAFLEE